MTVTQELYFSTCRTILTLTASVSFNVLDTFDLEAFKRRELERVVKINFYLPFKCTIVVRAFGF